MRDTWKLRDAAESYEQQQRDLEKKWQDKINEKEEEKRMQRQNIAEYKALDAKHNEMKTVHGKWILEELEALRRDENYRKAFRIIKDKKHRVIHTRTLTNPDEYQVTMPVDRTVYEVFLLEQNHDLEYTQKWHPKQWAEALSRRWDTSGQRIKLKEPTDFHELNYSSVQSLHDTMKRGKHIDKIAENIRSHW
jgi:hypothetical protein